MRQTPRAHYRRANRGLWRAVFKGLATVITGTARMGRFNSPSYPRDARSRDLERIGADMYAGFDAFGRELRRRNAEAARIESDEHLEGGKRPPLELLEFPSESVRAAVVESAACSGPLPPPTMYRGYNEVLPGSADRILRMAEKEQDRRIGRENAAMHRASQQDRLGLWMGFLITAFAVFTSAWLAMNGHDAVAGVIGCMVLAGAVAGLIRECRG